MTANWFYPEGHFLPSVPNHKSAVLTPSSGNFSDLDVPSFLGVLVASRSRRLRQAVLGGAAKHTHRGPSESQGMALEHAASLKVL